MDLRVGGSDRGQGLGGAGSSRTHAADQAWVAITSEPRRTDGRQHQLKGNLSTGSYRGETLPQWQFEATGGGRAWYLVDEANRLLVLTQAGTGHPKATDK